MTTSIWISSEEAAARIKKTNRQVHAFCRDGQLVCKKEEGRLLVAEESVQAFIELHEGTRVLHREQKPAAAITPASKPAEQAVTPAPPAPDGSPRQAAAPADSPGRRQARKSYATPEPAAARPPEAPVPVVRKTADRPGIDEAGGEEQPHYTELLATIRTRVAEHLEVQHIFCADMFSLLGSLEEVFRREEGKENQLTKEITKLLSRYSSDAEKRRSTGGSKPKGPMMEDVQKHPFGQNDASTPLRSV